MMKIALVLFLGLTIYSCSGPAPTAEDLETPQQYNDKIVGEQNKMMELILEMGDPNLSIDQIEEIRIKLVEQCKASIKAVSEFKPYDGDASMKKSALKLFNFYLTSCETHYKEMVEILKKGDDFTPEDMTRITELQQIMTEEEKPFDAEFQGAQKAFAAKHNLRLQQNEYQNKIDNL